MSTPVATIADALIAFILSLLRDPSAVEEFAAAPKAMLANNGLGDACAADVRAVKPVIVDHASVAARAVPQQYPPGNQFDSDPNPTDPVNEITRILNQFTSIDARTTIVDQSTNQNIWTEGGDVTQIFDQEAVVASGDEAVAAGDDATIVDSEVDVTVGDVAVGNSTAENSFNNTGVVPPVEGGDPALAAGDEAAASDAAAAAGDAVEGAVDSALDASAEAVEAAPAAAAAEPVAEPVSEPLADDMTASADAYESDDAGMVVEEAYVEEPTEEQ